MFVSRRDCVSGAGMREGLTEGKNFKCLLAAGLRGGSESEERANGREKFQEFVSCGDYVAGMVARYRLTKEMIHEGLLASDLQATPKQGFWLLLKISG